MFGIDTYVPYWNPDGTTAAMSRRSSKASMLTGRAGPEPVPNTRLHADTNPWRGIRTLSVKRMNCPPGAPHATHVFLRERRTLGTGSALVNTTTRQPFYHPKVTRRRRVDFGARPR